MTATRILPGDHAPWFHAQALSGSPRYAFDSVAGRHVLLLFMGSARFAPTAAALSVVVAHRALFDDAKACFFGITVDPEDAEMGRIAQRLPGLRFFLDYDRSVSRLYHAEEGPERYRPHWLVLDPALRVLGAFPVDRGEEAIACLRGAIEAAPPEPHAPVLVVPDVLEPELCQRLVGYYRDRGGVESGFMREVDGQTVLVHDATHKQRRDVEVDDAELRNSVLARLARRLTPAVQRAFAFEPTRIERHLIACYSAGAGHFRPHRDNTTKGTAHRRFAVTLNLNAGEYDGGDLRFPEFGPRTYRAPTGGAVVFSCSLLHEATPVTRGERFAYLPFLYDEAAAEVREANLKYLGENG
ncbi:2OG-Fe(II) oxygenase [Allosphingosinicella indica]|uniref:Predicted 2-oxoglutarate-and Fe(II)-dependent dioxygenase YbiX n=1 Tax=Allosphingosinicella indica TaxID=941907 RepID=A0A1X7GCN8_9SPHN|nr:2OG-Fe(II) oxygenase [Allosphingosinicella indica]SMF67561.1 Predicted 2-oxoglutarate-and Fe(II)-dependent dioxygenase YbiX [Allosphingosinicella indica]